MQINKMGMIGYTFGAMAGFFAPANIGPSSIGVAHATSAFDFMSPAWGKVIKEKDLKVRELTVEEISGIQDLYAAAAKRVIQAGFDYVMVHSAHGTLPCSFLSPYFNKRTDKYGGTIEKRCQFREGFNGFSRYKKFPLDRICNGFPSGKTDKERIVALEAESFVLEQPEKQFCFFCSFWAH